MKAEPRVLFDLGGVLIELGDLSTVLDHAPSLSSLDDFWSHWLRSVSVRSFESGALSAEDFGSEIVRELNLTLSPADFLSWFRAWPQRLVPGARELLHEFSATHVACLSNTNALHWKFMCEAFGLGELFPPSRRFLSFETGWLKPELSSFQHVTAALGCPPGQIYFIDDNLPNVDGAKGAGWHAAQGRELGEVRAALFDWGLLSASPGKPS